MSAVALFVFWASVSLLAWVYAGYPLLTLAYGRLRPVPLASDAPVPQVVTVGIAVHNAAAEIAGRVADVLAQDFDGHVEIVVASDGSTDATAAIVRALAQPEPRLRLIELPRAGQSAAQAAIFDTARGEVVVLTDSETRWAPGFLRALLTPFTDRRVGCTTGVLRWRYDAPSDTAAHEGLYWRYEQAVRHWESRAGWLSAGTGALLATRRSIYRPAPAHASLDQLLPLLTRAQRMLVLSVASAVGTDRGSSTLAEQVNSRIRIATQGIEANLRMAARITPWRSPGPALAIWSHKILRWMTPWLASAAAAAALVLVATGEVGYFVALAAGAALGALAALGYGARRIGRSVPLATLALSVLAVNACFALAWVNVLLRRRIGSW